MPDQARKDLLASGDLLSIAQASKLTPYSAEYLGLLARKGKFPAIKIANNWVTTGDAVGKYVSKQQERRLANVAKRKRSGKKTQARRSLRLLATALAVGVWVGVIPVLALAAEISYTADTTVALTSPAVNLTIKSGSEATSVVINIGSITASLPVSTVFTVVSASRGLAVAKSSPNTDVDISCDSGVATATVTTSATTIDAVTFTPTATQCVQHSSGGGGGGSAPPTPTPGPVPPSVNSPHPPGSVVRAPDGTVWFVTTDYTGRPFTSAGAFLSYGFLSFDQVVEPYPVDYNLPVGPFVPPMNGRIICSDRDDSYAKKGTCYLITEGKRAAFTSANVFKGLGFSFSRAQSGDVSFMEAANNISSATSAHRPGVLINNGGTIQLIGPSSLLGIPSTDVFYSWGFNFADVVPANAADRAIPQAAVLSPRVPGQLNP